MPRKALEAIVTTLAVAALPILCSTPTSLVAQPHSPSGEDVPAANDAELIRWTRAFLDERADRGLFSGGVLVARRNVPVFEGAWGLANRRYGIPNHLDTRFNLGSMNKMFTALAIAQLVESGRLGWRDPVAKYLPEYPNEAVRSQVTIHHLLTHTSGLGSHFTEAFLDASRLLFREPADYFPLFAETPLAFPPGSDWAYSNAGFFLLGAVIEAVSDLPYHDYVSTRIFETAGMNASGSFAADHSIPNVAVGYYQDDEAESPTVASGPWLENTLLQSYRGTPAGGGYSTLGDLNRFAFAFLSDRLVQPETREMLVSPKVEKEPRFGDRRAYGYGFSIRWTQDGYLSFGHSGGFPGIQARLEIFPELEYTVIVLSNQDRAAEPVARQIRAWLPRTPKRRVPLSEPR